MDIPITFDEKYKKSSLHSISPYVGKLRPDLVNYLIMKYSTEDDTIFDPFCGSGTVPLEAWICSRRSVGVDMNYYAYILTTSKLNPISSKSLAIEKLEMYNHMVCEANDLLTTDSEWVKSFFHPQTLLEIEKWVKILKQNNEYFILACLLGILHHQRPGFLSYPSSHGVPYLRNNKYPFSDYPKMYEYRNVHDRLKKKVLRATLNMPDLDYKIAREVIYGDTLNFQPTIGKNYTIITSPPYMNSLTYARDNRLRLYFLGFNEWEKLDKDISSGKARFFKLISQCFQNWSNMQRSGKYCILIIGDIEFDRVNKVGLPALMCELANENGYDTVGVYNYPISSMRKVVKGETKIKSEKICVFRKR